MNCQTVPIIVSEETLPTALEINEIRKEKGWQPLEIEMIPFVYFKDGNVISSTRIRKGEIDREGCVIKWVIFQDRKILFII